MKRKMRKIYKKKEKETRNERKKIYSRGNIVKKMKNK